MWTLQHRFEKIGIGIIEGGDWMSTKEDESSEYQKKLVVRAITVDT